MVNHSYIAAIVLAAGKGVRFGGKKPKQYQLLDGEPVLRHTVRVFASYHKLTALIVVIPPGDKEAARQALGEFIDRVILVEGGLSRQQSTLFGLRALRQLLSNNEADLQSCYVHIHDGARPCVSHSLLDRIMHALQPHLGIVPAVAIAETMKKSHDNKVIQATIDRQGCYLAQTPQSFPFAPILAAHEKAALETCLNFTDDSSVAEWYGLEMHLIEGEVNNVKITHADDLVRVNQSLMDKRGMFPDLRTGNGYDVHRLEKGDGVTLCGVKIAHHLQLVGHSDADVALHALTDALLATVGAGDIGTHFPPSDPQWRGAKSHIFVEHAIKLIRQQGGRIVNIDITLIAESPKIGPHRPAMVACLAAILQVEASRISVKATTNERLGFIGREEGIAAIATANVFYPGEVML